MKVAPNILPGEDPLAIQHAAQLLLGGDLVGMPTETVYGLAANALDVSAVAKVFEAKARPSFDPLIVHLADAAHADRYAELDGEAKQLAQAFWPGPVTLVLPRRHDSAGRPVVPDLVTAGLDSVALRVPDHPVAQALLKQSGLPLAAPSANRFGSISPTSAQHVYDELGDRVALILDGGACERGVESTVLRVSGDRIEVLRLGSLPIEAITSVAGRSVQVLEPTSSPGLNQSNGPMLSPGLAKRHYAPATPMHLIDSPEELKRFDMPGRLGFLCVGPLPINAACFAAARTLSEIGDLAEAASCLFATLRELDAMDLDGIVARSTINEGLGRAINDRLLRGSAR